MHLGLLLMKVTDCLNGPLIKGTHGNALSVMIKSCKHRNSCNLHVEPLILKHNTILHRKRLLKFTDTTGTNFKLDHQNTQTTLYQNLLHEPQSRCIKKYAP